MSFTSSPPNLIASVHWTGANWHAGSTCPGMSLPAAQTNSYVVRLAARLEAGVAVEVRLGDRASGNVPAIPAAGTFTNDIRIKMWTTALAGPVQPFPGHSVLSSDAVRLFGSLLSMDMSFSPARAGAITAISIAFSVDVLLFPGDVISLQLGGFSSLGGVDITSLPVVSFADSHTGVHYEDVVTGSLSEANSTGINSSGTLLLAVQSYLPARTVLTIRISAEQGLRLPSDGVHASSQLFLTASLLAGPVPSTLLTDAPYNIQTVGAFQVLSLNPQNSKISNPEPGTLYLYDPAPMNLQTPETLHPRTPCPTLPTLPCLPDPTLYSHACLPSTLNP